MDVDTSAVGRKSPGAADAASSAGGLSALQEVAASLANVKAAIKTGAADRNQVIDMLTNLLRETLQVNSCIGRPYHFHILPPLQRCKLLEVGSMLAHRPYLIAAGLLSCDLDCQC